MLSLGPLAFLNPWLLAPLAGLPLLWWLLRLTPPAPRRVRFPAMRLLLQLKQQEETPAHTPWWLLLLRCLIIALILTGLAQPLLNPSAQLAGSGPLLLVIDDGWTAGPSWIRTQSTAQQLLREAERNERPVRLLFTAPPADGQPIAVSDVLRAADARERLSQQLPSPWPVDRLAASKALAGVPESDVFYLSDGTGGMGTIELLEALPKAGPTLLYRPEGGRLPLLLQPPALSEAGVEVIIRRAGALPETTATLRATAHDGRLLARQEVTLPANLAQVTATLRLPPSLRNSITRLELEGESSAGAVILLDNYWRQRPVGILTASGGEKPLIGEAYYLQRALKPYAELRQGELGQLLTQGLSLLIMADIGGLGQPEQAKLKEWIDKGGVLLRFAGPALAANPDDLLPVRLRGGERNLKGTLTWAEPLPIRSFSPNRPLSGLVPPADVRIERQVLAEPAADLTAKTWASLADGTPLVTGQNIGKGWLVLVHTTANADWSNLPLSGLYVDLLRRVLELSQGLEQASASDMLQPIELIGGLGQSLPPPPTTQAITQNQTAITPQHPPGFYGAAGMRYALNLSASINNVSEQPTPPSAIQIVGADAKANELALMPWLLSTALLLMAVDLLIILRLRGLLARGLVAGLLLLVPIEANAQADDNARAEKTWLAYVQTGDAGADSQSDAGLKALSKVLTERTSVEPAGVVGVDLSADELAFYPLLYWPVTSSQPDLSEAERARVNSYLRHGGMIVFDTLDGWDGGGANPELIRLTQGLELPALQPIRSDHVITRSFFLLQSFPGTYPVSTLWADADPERRNDSVSSVLIGGGNWAAAWSSNNSARSSEMAKRFGVNLVMYALAGNYKSDQIHVQTILERIGQ
jgi:hypothetical protein